MRYVEKIKEEEKYHNWLLFEKARFEKMREEIEQSLEMIDEKIAFQKEYILLLRYDSREIF
jgi:hypothetical protein